MARSGTNTRQRQMTLSARFNAQEADAVRLLADRAGVSIASFIRLALLNTPPPRAARRPTVNHREVARLLGELGRIATALHDAGRAGNLCPSTPEVAQALRSLSEMRLVCLKALGRAP